MRMDKDLLKTVIGEAAYNPDPEELRHYICKLLKDKQWIDFNELRGKDVEVILAAIKKALYRETN